ncbi:endonuclease/exonuclease/phosphatase family protein [soil metagenome]
MVILVVTQVIGYTGNKYVASFQALTPYLLFSALPMAVITAITGRWPLAGVSGVIALVLMALTWPLVYPGGQPEAMPDATPLRVFHANLLYLNTDVDDLVPVIADLDVDVLAFTEYTSTHSAALHASAAVDDAFPYRIEEPGPAPGGTALWSRYPLERLESPQTRFRTAIAIVDGPQRIAVFVVHLPSPLLSVVQWNTELGQIQKLDTLPDIGYLVVGDLNASYWHPAFRRILGDGWRDAHQQMRRGLSTSWPNDLPLVPTFVRLDHALVNDRLVVNDIYDVDVPGSDHRGFVVTVVPAA